MRSPLPNSLTWRKGGIPAPVINQADVPLSLPLQGSLLILSAFRLATGCTSDLEGMLILSFSISHLTSPSIESKNINHVGKLLTLCWNNLREETLSP